MTGGQVVAPKILMFVKVMWTHCKAAPESNQHLPRVREAFNKTTNCMRVARQPVMRNAQRRESGGRYGGGHGQYAGTVNGVRSSVHNVEPQVRARTNWALGGVATDVRPSTTSVITILSPAITALLLLGCRIT